MVGKNNEHSIKLRQKIRNFLVRDFGWEVIWMGDYSDIFVNQYKAVVVIVQYHIEKKLAVAVIRSDEMKMVRGSTIFSTLKEFRDSISYYL